jgi:phosphoribosylanthranilate isomerase
VIQLVDSVETQVYRDLRVNLPGVNLVQVIHVLGEDCVAEPVARAPYVDALLFDSGNPNLTVKELGGTGRVHDWRVSRRIRDAVAIPVFLAGGLNERNVAEAIGTVGPFGVDVCSGVRTEGRLDENKLRAFMAAVIGASPSP